jgi:hypothetical protein
VRLPGDQRENTQSTPEANERRWTSSPRRASTVTSPVTPLISRIGTGWK